MDASTSAVPSLPLTLLNSEPPADKTTPTPARRFILFGKEWLRLQTLIGAALKLPINHGGFTDKYGGGFSSEGEVKGCLDAMTNLHNLSSTFGNPVTLKEKIVHEGGYLFTATPPEEIYAHIVWLALQIENTASTFNYTFANLQPLLSPAAGTPKQRAENLKTILTGEGGLVSTAHDMQEKTAALLSKLAAFDGQLQDASTQIMKYTGSSSAILKEASTLLGSAESSVTNLTNSANEAHKKWENYTIAAVTTSVGITILSGGLLWYVGLGLGVGLGVAAAKELALYNDLMEQVATAKEDVQKKTRLVTDLQGLNKSVPGVTDALSSFRTKLEQIEGVWVNIGGNLAYIANNYTDEQLSNYPWIQQAMKIGEATDKWQSISNTASQFTQNSLVTMSTDVEFGQKIAA